MNTRCIAYVTDENYFFPTAISALQAKEYAKDSTDILIVVTETFRNIQDARSFCDRNRITLIDASEKLKVLFQQLDLKQFSHRISIATMGRLLLGEIIPEAYTEIIYIDGDTQITGPLAVLEEAVVPAGKFFSALDYLALEKLVDGQEAPVYFNPGVLKFNRHDWIGRKAFNHYVENGGTFHDQGALNAVGQNDVILISSRWNFPKQFLHLVGEIKPVIVHYMAHPKPWDGVYFPWKRSDSTVYDLAVANNPELKSFRHKIGFMRLLVYRIRSIRERIRFHLQPKKATFDRIMQKHALNA